MGDNKTMELSLELIRSAQLCTPIGPSSTIDRIQYYSIYDLNMTYEWGEGEPFYQSKISFNPWMQLTLKDNCFRLDLPMLLKKISAFFMFHPTRLLLYVCTSKELLFVRAWSWCQWVIYLKTLNSGLRKKKFKLKTYLGIFLKAGTHCKFLFVQPSQVKKEEDDCSTNTSDVGGRSPRCAIIFW